jgi:hypothetical protein
MGLLSDTIPEEKSTPLDAPASNRVFFTRMDGGSATDRAGTTPLNLRLDSNLPGPVIHIQRSAAGLCASSIYRVM